jgi:hypothetical protein
MAPSNILETIGGTCSGMDIDDITINIDISMLRPKKFNCVDQIFESYLKKNQY